jgi:hypothetical protein
MRNVFDQHTEMDHDGIVTGGNGKVLCLLDLDINKKTVQNLVKTPCGKIIEDLRALFRDFYHYSVDVAPNLSAVPEPDGSSTGAALYLRGQEATEKLSSSKWILEMIDAQLSFKWDVDDDGSLHKTMLRPDSAASRDRRKRKAVDSNEEKMTDNKRRRGRLPPPSTEPSRDTLWSQGTYSSSPHTPGTLPGTSSRSATRVSTRSPSLRSYSRSGKAMSTHR